jgi:hydroxymethylglutaryl-CoA reductase
MLTTFTALFYVIFMVNGFSKLNKDKKIAWLSGFFKDPEAAVRDYTSFHHPVPEMQRIIDGFTENAISNYVLPYSIAPNFLINSREYAVPMVIEESSVVAAASSAAKFWAERGGFHAEVTGVVKLGQVHFRWPGTPDRLQSLFPLIKACMIQASAHLTANMEKRGGGILDVELLDFTALEPHYYQICASFNTCDSMGANFVNSVLECFADALEQWMTDYEGLSDTERDVEVIMSILSNYTPDCAVHVWCECSISSFEQVALQLGMDARTLADRFALAVRIAQIDPYRATTHNKGIFNGIDAVVMATGNDFRAVEACGHTHASRSGQYRSLSTCTISGNQFRFEMHMPLALGSVGGLTALHPLAKHSLELLGNPSASELMCIAAAVGLAQNFAAVRSLVTTGIQKGHMKMHLTNILNHLGASEEEAAAAQYHFARQTVSFSGVRAFLEKERKA